MPMRTTMAPGAGSSMRAGAASLGERGPPGPRAGSSRVSSRRPAPGSPAAAARGCRSGGGGGSGGGDYSGLSCLLPAGLRGMLRAARRGGRHRHRGPRSQPARGPCGVRRGGERGCRDPRGHPGWDPAGGPRQGRCPARGPGEDPHAAHGHPRGDPAVRSRPPPRPRQGPSSVEDLHTAHGHPHRDPTGGHRQGPSPGWDPAEDTQPPLGDLVRTPSRGPVEDPHTPPRPPPQGPCTGPPTAPHRDSHLVALTQEPLTNHAGISQRHPHRVPCGRDPVRTPPSQGSSC